jgi:hypothetical protein
VGSTLRHGVRDGRRHERAGLPPLSGAGITSLGSVLSEEAAMAGKKPTKKDLSKAGKDLQNPRTREKRETEAAKTLRKGRKKP